MRLVKPVMKKPLRQQNRQIISYVPRTEPAPPEHAIKMDSFRDVWMLRGKYVALDRKSTRLNSSHSQQSRMPSSA